MKREIITISENGIITMPTVQILMRDFEIAELFGVFSQTVKSAIKSILKSGIVTPDYTYGGVAIGNSIQPAYFGLNMITAIAFRIQSKQVHLFREYLLRQLCTVGKLTTAPVFIQVCSDSDKSENRFIN